MPLLKQFFSTRLYWVIHDFVLKFWMIFAGLIVLFWGGFIFVEFSEASSYSEYSFSEFIKGDDFEEESDFEEDFFQEEKVANRDSVARKEPIKKEEKKTVKKTVKKQKKLGTTQKALRLLKARFPGKKFVYHKTVKAKVTAYTTDYRSCGRFADGKTSIGDNARIYNGVATDKRMIPYRYGVYIPMVGAREVDDTGGAMRQAAKRGIYHIDVRVRNNRKARRWGVRWLNVQIFKLIK